MTDKNASSQAQAEEPEIIAMFQKTSYGDYPQIKWKDGYFAKIGDSFITLQSHREAMDHVKAHAEYQRKSLADWVQELITSIDKKDTALKSQNDALIAIYDRANAETMAQARAAIKRGQGALNDMG